MSRQFCYRGTVIYEKLSLPVLIVRDSYFYRYLKDSKGLTAREMYKRCSDIMSQDKILNPKKLCRLSWIHTLLILHSNELWTQKIQKRSTARPSFCRNRFQKRYLQKRYLGRWPLQLLALLHTPGPLQCTASLWHVTKLNGFRLFSQHQNLRITTTVPPIVLASTSFNILTTHEKQCFKRSISITNPQSMKILLNDE